MDITFVLETGAGIMGATSYVDIMEFKQYWFNKNWNYDTLSDNDIMRLLNNATAYIDSNYSFSGCRQTSVQSLEYPRSSSYYLDGFEIDENTIPAEIKKAVNHMAYLIESGNDPEAIISKDGKIIAESSAVDVIKESTKYEEGTSFYSDIYVPIDNILYRLTGGVSNNFILKVIRTGGESR